MISANDDDENEDPNQDQPGSSRTPDQPELDEPAPGPSTGPDELREEPARGLDMPEID